MSPIACHDEANVTYLSEPEFAEPFRAYMNYLVDLAGMIAGEYGFGSSVAAGVHEAVFDLSAVQKIRRRGLDPEQRGGLEKALRRSWGHLRRAHMEVEDLDDFNEEANALLPVMSHYSVYDAVAALTVASNQRPPRDHAAGLKIIGKEVQRGVLPFPWSTFCSGDPLSDRVEWTGFSATPQPVHVLSSPDPWSSEDRLAMLLRTTRRKELERRLSEERHRKVAPGRTRRNLSRVEKEAMARAMAPTTLFDFLWRLRKKASYEDADVFVLGAQDEVEAKRFADALVIVTDATVAAIEAVISAYVGPTLIADMLDEYADRCGPTRTGRLDRHGASLRRSWVA